MISNEASSNRIRIGYASVSTNDQNPALQLDALARVGCEKIYEEYASGKGDDRIELAHAHAHAQRPCVPGQPCRLASRSARSIVTASGQYRFRTEGARRAVRKLDGKAGYCQRGGRLTFHIFASLTQFERQLISERTKAGLAAASQSACHVEGRPVARFERKGRDQPRSGGSARTGGRKHGAGVARHAGKL